MTDTAGLSGADAAGSTWRKRWMPPLLLAVLVVAVGALVAVLHSGRATLRKIPGPSAAQVSIDGDKGWCLVAGEEFPEATGRWGDGILHGGPESVGIVRYDDERTATFVGDASNDEATHLFRCS